MNLKTATMNKLQQLIEKYRTNGPRYTSYPTALHFSENCDRDNLVRLALAGGKEASLYVHIPFCRTLCAFCGCSSSVCLNPAEVDDYLELLEAELELWRRAGLQRRVLKQIHFGGGTPNFLTAEQIFRLNATIERHFEKDALDCEFSVELDPRTLTWEKVSAFASIGVNRASIGVQDTDIRTQRAIGRIQPQEKNLEAVEWLRKSGIDKINVDLVYGLPFQTADGFLNTARDALSLRPTRIALFGYAHVPWIKASQKSLERYPMPNPAEKAEIFLAAKDAFEKSGFEFIGLDHFALPADPLIQARKNGTLHRNFQGYTTRAGLDCFAVGLTSISETKTSYRQNHKGLDEYRRLLRSGKLPIARGIVLDAEDILRRAVIMDVMCLLNVRFDRYGADFREKFASAFPALEEMQADGLVEIFDDRFEVTKLGRLFVRNIAMLFDGRLGGEKSSYSKTL